MDKLVIKEILSVDLSDFKLPTIAIYEHPKDYPEYYVARVFDVEIK